MAIYNKNGEIVSMVYDYQGSTLQQAYDKDGNPLMSSSFIVMSYNVQSFKGINSQQSLQNAIVYKYNADFIGFQEFYNSNTMPQIASNMLVSYDYLYRSSHKTYIAMASKKQMTDFLSTDFVTQDPRDLEEWGLTRQYIKGYLNIWGHNVCIINTHLCLTASPRWAQMAELFEIAENEEYCILIGDFNSYSLSIDGDDYIHMHKPFVDAGYKLANSNFTKTFTEAKSASSLNDFDTAPDNIIVSGNINIDSVVFDTTKLNYLNGSNIDHIPIIATLSIENGD